MQPQAPPPPAAPQWDVATDCPTVRHDLCGALHGGDYLYAGERLQRADGAALCFTASGDVVELDPSGGQVDRLGLSDSSGRLVMQNDGNLVFYSGSIGALWAFNKPASATCATSGGTSSCFLSWATASACSVASPNKWWVQTCSGTKLCAPPHSPQ